MKSNFHGRTITGETPQEAYEKAQKVLRENGRKKEVRGEKTLELLNTTIHAKNTGVVDAESVELDYIAQEIANIFKGEDCTEEHPEFVKEYLNPDGSYEELGNNIFWGPEVREALTLENIHNVCKRLKQDESTRRGVFALTTNDLISDNDIPCLIAAHAIIRDGKLHFQVLTRSSDMKLGVPYDFHLFATVQTHMASIIGVDSGEIAYRAVSLHTYEQEEGEFENIKEREPRRFG